MNANVTALSDRRFKAVLGKHTYYVKQLVAPVSGMVGDLPVLGSFRVEPPESEGAARTVEAYDVKDAVRVFLEGPGPNTAYPAARTGRYSPAPVNCCTFCGAFPGQMHQPHCKIAGRMP